MPRTSWVEAVDRGLMVDHLAEIGARVPRRRTEPDGGHGSLATTPADLAPFTAEDLDEARGRLLRLARIWDVRLRSLCDEQHEAAAGDAGTLRQVAFHVADCAFYAAR
jgi:hypothetical protein